MPSIKCISLVGSGNVATHLANAFFDIGISIEWIFSRNEFAGTSVAKKVNAKFGSLDEINLMQKTQLLIIAVSDTAIFECVQLMQNINCAVVHTSGSIDSKVFENKFSNFGVFYPLQTFTKGAIIDLEKVPICVFGNQPIFEIQLKELANKISKNVQCIDDEKRHKLHISAVVVNNFTNHLIALIEAYCLESELDFELLKPLIYNTFHQIEHKKANDVQTGPARRGDKLVVNKHLETLKKSEINHLEAIYSLLSASIFEHYSKD